MTAAAGPGNKGLFHMKTINKLTSVFQTSFLLLMINCVMTIIVKVAVEPPAAGEGYQIRQFLSNSTIDSSAFSP